MEKVWKYWDQGMVITDFDYGGGTYVVVMSRVKGWREQRIRHDCVLPTFKISQLRREGYYITNVLYDGSDWIVVMTEVDYCADQTCFICTRWSEFIGKINEGWEDRKVVTKLCCQIKRSYNKYLAVMTKFKDCSPE